MFLKKITSSFLLLLFIIYSSFWSVLALAPGDISNGVFFLDAQNVDWDWSSGNEPSDNSSVTDIIDTFNAFTWSQSTSSKKPTYKTNSINIYPSLKFDWSADYLNITDNQTINTATGYTQKSYAMIIKTWADITTLQTLYEEWWKEKWYSFQIDQWHLYAWAYNSIDWAVWHKTKIIDLWTITAHTVYTIFFVFDSDSNSVTWYLDWTLISTLSTVTQQKTHGSCILDAWIGCSLYSTWSTSIWLWATKNDVLRLSNTTETEILEWHYFTGNIWEISSYNHALTLVEITGLQDYLADKWYWDITAPVITWTNYASGSILPWWNHNLEFDYNDTHSWSVWIDTSSENLVLEKWNGTSWVANAGISNTSTTITKAIYATSNLAYWKYRATFNISDNNSNISNNEVIIFYIDIPSMVISEDEFTLWELNDTTNTYSQIVTINVKTVWVPFRVKIQNDSANISSWWENIIPYNWIHWYWKKDGSSIVALITEEEIANQTGALDTDWNLNSYTYNVQLWAIIESLQTSGDYDWTVKITIEYDY